MGLVLCVGSTSRTASFLTAAMAQECFNVCKLGVFTPPSGATLEVKSYLNSKRNVSGNGKQDVERCTHQKQAGPLLGCWYRSGRQPWSLEPSLWVHRGAGYSPAPLGWHAAPVAGKPVWCGGRRAHLRDTEAVQGLDLGGNPEGSAGGLGSVGLSWDS